MTMKISNLLMLIGGLGCWLLFIIGVSIGSFGVLENLGSTFSSNLFFYISFIFAGLGTVAFLVFLKKSKMLSISVIGGLLATTYLSALVLLWLHKALRLGSFHVG